MHGKTPAQEMIRWHLQEGRSAIPKSVRAKRIAENFDVFDFELTTDELATLDKLGTGVCGGPEPKDIPSGTSAERSPKRDTARSCPRVSGAGQTLTCDLRQ